MAEEAKELLGLARLLQAYVRDAPKLQKRLRAAGHADDANAAKELMERAELLLDVLDRESRPAGQVLSPDGVSTIGFANADGSVVPAPVMPRLAQLPVVPATKLGEVERQAARFRELLNRAAGDFLQVES